MGSNTLIYCSNCGAANEKVSTFCLICGKELYKPSICKDCGKENPRRSEFCFNCGSKNLVEEKARIPLQDKNNKDSLPFDHKLNQVSKWTDSCPVCRKGRLDYHVEKIGIGLIKRKTYDCDYCGAVFLKREEGYQLSSIRDEYETKGDYIWSSYRVWFKYNHKTLKGEEWADIPDGYRSYGMEKVGDVKYFGDESIRYKIDSLLDSYFFKQDFHDNRNIKTLEELKSRFFSELKKDGLDKYRIDRYADDLDYEIKEYPDPFLYKYYPVLGELLNVYLKNLALSSIRVDIANKKVINTYKPLKDLLNTLTEEQIRDYTSRLEINEDELNKILNKCLVDSYDKIVKNLNSSYEREFKEKYISTDNMLILESKIRLAKSGYGDVIEDFLIKE